MFIWFLKWLKYFNLKFKLKIIVRVKKLRNNSFFLYIRMSLVIGLVGLKIFVYYSLFFLYMLG